MGTGYAELRQRVRDRGYELTKGASDLLVDRLRDEAGPTLRPETVRLTAPAFRPERWSTTLTVDHVGTLWQWETGDPANEFEPHHVAEIDGATFDATTYLEVLAKDPGEFPHGTTFWFPGDHPGCRCRVVNVVGDEPFDPNGTGGTSTSLRVGNQTVTVRQSATVDQLVPDWWTEVVDDNGWSEALEDVQ